MKQYILTDAFDGKTIINLFRVSSLSLARKAAQEFSKTTTDNFDLIEIGNKGERVHIQRYVGKYIGRSSYIKV